MRNEERQLQYERAERLYSEQNFTAAVVAGAVAMFLGAVSYALIARAWSFAYGFGLAGIGIFVGMVTSYLGRGIENKFALLATGYTIVGCILGSVFAVSLTQASLRGIAPFEALGSNFFEDLQRWANYRFSLIDVVYIFVAVIFSIMLAKRALSREERLAIGLLQRKRDKTASD